MNTEYKSEKKQAKGTLDEIRFRNDDGFMIGIFLDDKNKRFSALGNMVNPQIGLEYILTGDWSVSDKFGEQLKFSAYESILPVDSDGIHKYIVRVCKFVGTSVGSAIIALYGDQTLTVMKNEPHRLAEEISGITLDKAMGIQKSLKENEANEKIMIALEVMFDIPGMRKNLPGQVIKEFGSDSVDIIKSNPYILTKFNGVGFPLADRVALNIGCKRDSIFRKESAVLQIIEDTMREGSTWIYKDELIIKIRDLVQAPNMPEGVESLLSQGVIVYEDGYYALSSVAKDERIIAETLLCLGVA